jgi:hypothetical protein
MADLITLAKYKEFEGIDSTTNDLKFQTIIPAVSQLVKTYCANSFVDFFSTNKTEIFTLNWNTHAVQLTESPINSIVSVKERQSYSGTYTTLTTSSFEYYLDYSTDSIIRTDSSGNPKNFPKGVGAVEVVYTAGYSTIPEDLMLAVVDLITYYFKKEHKQRRTLGGATLDNPGTSSLDSGGLPDHIKRVLDMYKNF